MVAMVTDGDLYVTGYHPWTAMTRAAIHAGLDEAARVLADQKRFREAPATETEYRSPTIARAGEEFAAAIEALMARGDVLPMYPSTSRPKA